jgi:hypothetical protein
VIMSRGGQYLVTTTKIGGFLKNLIRSGAAAVEKNLTKITNYTHKLN